MGSGHGALETKGFIFLRKSTLRPQTAEGRFLSSTKMLWMETRIIKIKKNSKDHALGLQDYHKPSGTALLNDGAGC